MPGHNFRMVLISEAQNALEDALEEHLSSALMAFCFEQLARKNDRATQAAYWQERLAEQLRARAKIRSVVERKAPRLCAAVEAIWRIGLDGQDVAVFWTMV